MANIRVLVADDSQEFRQILRHLLDREPEIRVVGEAGDGREAIRLAHQLRPDIILMDLEMPHVDGIQATREIRTSLPGVRVLGLSAYNERSFVDAMFKAGASAYALKSDELSLLVRNVHKAVDESPNGEDPTRIQ